MFPISIASKLKNFFNSSLVLLIQFFHVHVEMTVIVIFNFLLFDYINICVYVSCFLSVTQNCSMSFSKSYHISHPCPYLTTEFEICLGSRQMQRLLPRHIYIFLYLPQQKKKCWGNWMMMMMFSTQITNLISWRRPFTVLSTYFCVLFSYFCCSLILVSKKWDIERRLTQG